MPNGSLPKSKLARVYHPTAEIYLEKEAAAAWNSMRLEARRRFKTDIYPGGPDSAYRTLARQKFWRNYWCNQGNCGNAAVPGTSNHGLGLAVDLPTRRMRFIVDRIGARAGWAKKWSDAPQEWWHLKYNSGVWTKRPDPGIDAKNPVLRKGSGGIGQDYHVRSLKRLLARHGYKNVEPKGEFGAKTADAVKRFQKSKKLKADGVVGEKTWWHLRQRPKRVKAPVKKTPAAKVPAKKPASKPKKPKKLKPLHGIDVSTHNGGVDWSKVAAAGVKYSFQRVGYIGNTAGGYHEDETFTQKRLESMRRHGVTPGYYAYLIPNKRQNPANLAVRIVKQIRKQGGLVAGDIPFAVDVEESKLTAKETQNWIRAFVKAYRASAGHSPIIYAGSYWREEMGNPSNNFGCELWLPAYTKSYKPYVPKAWKRVLIWQYTEKGKVDGVNGVVDCNWLYAYVSDIAIRKEK